MRPTAIKRAARPAHADPLLTGRGRFELTALFLMLLVHSAVYAFRFDELYSALNWFTPIVLTSVLCWSCLNMVRDYGLTLWTPLFWFRLACAVYYGFGALVPLVADWEMSRGMDSIYVLDSASLFKVNLVSLAGIFFVLWSSRIVLGMRPDLAISDSTGVQAPERRAFRFSVYFLLAGGAIRYGVVLPYVLGVTDVVLPGVVIALGKIYYVGLYLLIRSMRRAGPERFMAAFVLVATEVIISVASFSKTDLIMVLVFSFLAVVENKKRAVVFLSGVACIAFVYLSFQSLVMYGRDRVVQVHGSINGAGLGERLEIIRDYATVEGRLDRVSYGSGLSRLSYASPNAFVIAQFDAGLPGNTLRNAFAVMVPRMLWPDKPIITKLGEDLYFAVSGRHGSAMAVGHFSEAYWNFGWGGLLLMLPIGFLLAVFSRISLSIMVRRDWLFLPIVFMGVQLGLRVDGHFVSDVVGAAWLAFVVWSALRILSRSTEGRQRTS